MPSPHSLSHPIPPHAPHREVPNSLPGVVYVKSVKNDHPHLSYVTALQGRSYDLMTRVRHRFLDWMLLYAMHNVDPDLPASRGTCISGSIYELAS